MDRQEIETSGKTSVPLQELRAKATVAIPPIASTKPEAGIRKAGACDGYSF
jgi:hypothetical protein